MAENNKKYVVKFTYEKIEGALHENKLYETNPNKLARKNKKNWSNKKIKIKTN